MDSMVRRATRALAVAGIAAGLCAALATGAAAQAPAPGAAAPREPMAQEFATHVQGHLDQLAERLEIKASQEPAWQAFAAAFRDVMTPRAADVAAPRTADADAASLVREHADRAAAHAQKLARLADATAKLQQVLNADQRTVLNEVARHVAREHFARAGMMRGDYPGHGGPRCDSADGRGRGERAGPMRGDDGPGGGGEMRGGVPQ